MTSMSTTERQNRLGEIEALFQRHGLVDLLQTLEEQDALVFNGETPSSVVEASGTFSCTLLHTDEHSLQDHDFSCYNRVVVFCESNERLITRLLRQSLPRSRVLSATYDILPQCILGKPALESLRPRKKKRSKSPVIVFSEPNSGADFFLDLMHSAKLVNGQELHQKFGAWFTSQNDFHPVRYIAAMHTAGDQHGIGDLHCCTSLLQDFSEINLLGCLQLGWWLKKIDASVIYFDRRDKFIQTLETLVLQNAMMTSVADFETPEKLMAIQIPSLSVQRDTLDAMIRKGAEFELYCKQQEIRLVPLTFEEAVEAPIAVLKALSKTLGRGTPREVAIPDVSHYSLVQDVLAEAVETLREDFLSCLGLELSEEGSFFTETDRLRRYFRGQHEAGPES